MRFNNNIKMWERYCIVNFSLIKFRSPDKRSLEGLPFMWFSRLLK